MVQTVPPFTNKWVDLGYDGIEKYLKKLLEDAQKEKQEREKKEAEEAEERKRLEAERIKHE